MIVMLMGVSGSRQDHGRPVLAEDLGWPFFDADDFHPPANVAKMAPARRSTDADRWPWLDRLGRRGGEQRARRKRGARLLGAEAGLPRPASRARATSVSSTSGATTTRSPRGSPRARTATCRRRCSRASSPRWRSRRTRSSSTSGERFPAQVAQIRARAQIARTPQRVSDDKYKPATRALHLGRHPRDSSARSTRRCSARRRCCSRRSPNSSRREWRLRGHRLRAARTSDRHRSAGHGGGDRGRACRACRSVGADGDHAAAARPRAAGRPRSRYRCGVRPTRRFCNNHLMRLGVEITYYDPDGCRLSSANSGRTRGSSSPSRPAR